MRQMIRLLACGLMVFGICANNVFAQEPQKNETALTGCLNKDSSGGYTLTDEKTVPKPWSPAHQTWKNILQITESL